METGTAQKEGRAAGERWRGAASRRITERIVVEGTLRLQEPTHLGSGAEGDFVDMSLLVDTRSGAPLLTGASVAGALRTYLRTRAFGYRTPLPGPGSHQGKQQERDGWAVALLGGFPGDDEGAQSLLIVDDAYGRSSEAASSTVEVREGVSINAETRTAEEGALFDLEAWAAGTEFPLRFEMLVSAHEQAPERSVLVQALCAALEGLQKSEIPFGLRKRRGYGEAAVEQWRIRRYDMTDTDDLLDWLKNGGDTLRQSAEGVQETDDLWGALGATRPETDARTFFRLDATFSLDGSLLIRSPSSTGEIADAPDEGHLHALRADGTPVPVLSGTSLAGALRARARKVAKTVSDADPDAAHALVHRMFGYGPEDDTSALAPGASETAASRVQTRERRIENGVDHLVQQRVSIDRFTGGAYPGALFDQQPVFGDEDTSVQVELKHVKPGGPQGDARDEAGAGASYDAEIGLLLLLLKDLWSSDLPLGGESRIGRGRLKGKAATLRLQENGEERRWTLRQSDDQLNVEGDTSALETYVTALNQHLK